MSRRDNLSRMPVGVRIYQSEFSSQRALEHLDLICQSRFFSSSKRCQSFLRYIVIETLEGRAEMIGERNIARMVFEKGDDFEPGEHSLVRVKAGEVRKRISDYYDSVAPTTIRIELPLGGYVPRIHWTQEGSPADLRAMPQVDRDSDHALAAEEILVPSTPRLSRRRLAWLLGGVVVSATAVDVLFRAHNPRSALDLFWQPILASKAALLICVPVMRDNNGDLTEWVGMGPAATLSRAAPFLKDHHCPYQLRFVVGNTFPDLRDQPSLLLGGFLSGWTTRMSSELRFVPVSVTDGTERAILDRQTKQMWKPAKRTPGGYVDEDYGILSRLFDGASGQIIIAAVGTQTFGTESAASLLFDPILFASLIEKAPRDWESKNFQAIVHVSVFGTTPSSARLLAAHFW